MNENLERKTVKWDDDELIKLIPNQAGKPGEKVIRLGYRANRRNRIIDIWLHNRETVSYDQLFPLAAKHGYYVILPKVLRVQD